MIMDGISLGKPVATIVMESAAKTIREHPLKKAPAPFLVIVFDNEGNMSFHYEGFQSGDQVEMILGKLYHQVQHNNMKQGGG